MRSGEAASRVSGARSQAEVGAQGSVMWATRWGSAQAMMRGAQTPSQASERVASRAWTRRMTRKRSCAGASRRPSRVLYRSDEAMISEAKRVIVVRVGDEDQGEAQLWDMVG
jgi:hypothetical protein